MTEETTERFPQTWDELTAQDEFRNMPELVHPQDLEVTQSALFEVMRTRVSQRVGQLNELNVFNDKPVTDEDKAAILLAESVEYANMFFQSIAKSKKEWVTWTKGRLAVNLLYRFITLTRFYGEQLGK